MMLKKFKYNDIQQCHFSNICVELNKPHYKKDVESHKPNKIKSNYILILHDVSNFIHKNCIIHIKRINISLTWKRIQVLKVLYWK